MSEANTAIVAKITAKDQLAASGETMTKICEGLGTKSAKIRALNAAGFKTGAIALFLEIRYQHARNVLNMKLADKKA